MSLCEHGRPEEDCGECDAWAAAFLAEWAQGIDLGEDENSSL